MGKNQILLVEDDPNLGFILEENLELKGFSVLRRLDGENAYLTFIKEDIDLCLVDVMLPVKDGFTLAREIRKIDSDVPIIFLTAKSLKEDRIEGLKIGADDYVTKPFSMEELMLRINAVLKRSGRIKGSESKRDSLIKIGLYQFNPLEQLLVFRGKKQKLTYKESELLNLLTKHMNTLLERETALKTIWGNDNFFNARSMDVFITRLRKYLSKDSGVEIVNIHGKGFKLSVK